MAKCDFECSFIDDQGECEQMQGECIGDACENWKQCKSCINTEDCEQVRIEGV